MYSLKFTVQWGYRFGYFSPKHLPRYDFSGHIEIENGQLEQSERMSTKFDLWGPYIFSVDYVPYGKNSWESRIHNNFDGFRFTVQVEDASLITLQTQAALIHFTPRELKAGGHLVCHLAEKYSPATIHIETDPPEWHLAPNEPDEIRMSFDDLAGEKRYFFGVWGTLARPGKSIQGKLHLKIPDAGSDLDHTAIKFAVRFILSKNAEVNAAIDALPHFSIRANGRVIHQNRKFSMYEDYNAQMLDETTELLPADIFVNGENTIEVINEDAQASLLIQMLRFIPVVQRHLEILSCPRWVVVGVPFRILYRSTQAALVKIDYDERLLSLTVPSGTICDRTHTGKTKIIAPQQGENELFFMALQPFHRETVSFIDLWSGASSAATIEEAWDAAAEKNRFKTGIEIKTDNPLEYEPIIRQVLDRQMGNLIVFRYYRNLHFDYGMLWDAAARCRKYGLYTDTIGWGSLYPEMRHAVADASADHILCAGCHEDTGIYYSTYSSTETNLTLRDAMNTSVQMLRANVVGNRLPGVPVAIGDASGGSRYAYMAGYDIIRHETFVGSHMLILPNARGAARAYGRETWGAHVASQHNQQHELDDGLRRFWLGLFMPWVFGANFVFEEDSLYQNNKYVRMVNDDYMTRIKQEMTAQFHKYTQTHPRAGEPQVDIAVIQGRFAPPFNGLSTPSAPLEPLQENENILVWGRFGRNRWEWGYRQPEKGFHILEIFSPGIYLTPLNQDAHRVRRVFGADPRGEFDFLPIEASRDVFSQYKLALMLNWHTMEEYTEQQDDACRNDYDKLRAYVRDGGTLLISVPQLTTRADRELLLDMADIRPIYEGKVSDLFGVNIGAQSRHLFSGAVGCSSLAGVDFDQELDLIRLPNTSPDEDGGCFLTDIELTTAEVVVQDKATGRPLVVRNKVGNGYAYLLCVHAFPGHEAIKHFLPNLVIALIDRHVRRDVFVDDPSADVYWSVWKTAADAGKIYLLNTDWESGANQKVVVIHAGENNFKYTVLEGQPDEVAFCGNTALYADTPEVYIASDKTDQETVRYSIQGFGPTVLHVYSGSPAVLSLGAKTGLIKPAEEYVLPVNLDELGNSTELLIQRGAS